MFSQLNLRSIPAEAWTLAVTAAGFLAWLGKKLISRKQKPKPEPVTRAEFHQGLDILRDRIDILGTRIEQRLDRLDTTVARLDERTSSLTH